MSWRQHLLPQLLLFLLLVPLFNTLAVLALPGAVNRYVQHRIVGQALAAAAEPATDATVATRQREIIRRAGRNIALPAARADAQARTVVRPSPDLLYTACIFDLSEGPLRVSAPVPDSYLSVSGFAADTSNFFAINDSAIEAGADGQRRIELLLSHGPPTAAVADGVRVVQSPGRRGLLLFRMLIPDEAALPRLQAEFQAAQRCEPLL